jgi:hypothetical protein
MAYLEVGKDGELLTASRLRNRGLRRERHGQILLRWAPERGKEAEQLLRKALANLVDAFLIDRKGQSDLFGRAHVLGRDLVREIGCYFKYEDDKDTYTLRCPIFALHQKVALSVAWTLITRCSICEAGPFECDHVPGRSYGGAECYEQIDRVAGLGHVAWTANPDFLYTWHQPRQFQGASLLAEGRIARLGEEISCDHCVGCAGVIGPTHGDLDPVGRVRKLVAENRAIEPI